MRRREARDRASALCLALPGATSEGNRHLGFSVRGRRFAWVVDDHHGDGRLAIHCKAPPGENTTLAETDPARYFLPPYLARRGWIGAWLDIEGVDWERVEGLIVEAYRLSAPGKLATELDSSA